MFSKLLVEGAMSIRRRLVRDRNNSPGSGGVRHTAAPMNKPGYTRTASPLWGGLYAVGSEVQEDDPQVVLVSLFSILSSNPILE
jgi:hypothetical protein